MTTPERLRTAVVGGLPGLGVALLALATARWTGEREWAPAIAAIGVAAGLALALAGAIARRHRGAIAALALATAVVATRGAVDGPLWIATVVALAAAALALAAADVLARGAWSPPAAWIGLALAVALVLRLDLGVRPPETRMLIAALAAAVVAGAALGAVVRRRGRLLPVAAALALADRPKLARAARAAFAVAGLGALIAAAPPWSRPAPLAAVAGGLSGLLQSRVALRSSAGLAPLTAARPRVEIPLGGRPVRAATVDSALAEGAALACGTLVATVTLEASGEARPVGELRIGRDTADWSAARAGAGATVACAPPAPFAVWPAPGGGVAARYRSRWTLPAPWPAERLVVERAAELPSEVAILLAGVAVE